MKKNLKLLTFLVVPFMLLGCSTEGGGNNTSGSGDPIGTNPGDNAGDNGNNSGGNAGGNTGGNTGGETAPHEHTFAETWEKSVSQHWHKCTGTVNNANCTEKKDLASHSFGQWVIDSYAQDVEESTGWGQTNTVTRNGSKHADCTVCGYRKNAEVTDYDPATIEVLPESYTPKFTRSYTIFNKAPEIKFKTSEGTDFATKPNKSKGGGDPWEVTGTFTTSNTESKYAMTNVTGAMKVRGNFTTDYEKKGFRLKFDKSTNLFGLNSGQKYKKWVTFADVKDTSMLRNATGFFLARNIVGDNVFVTDFTPAHIYINDQYWGLYLLAEQKENKAGRIRLPDIDTSYTGTDIGYCFELDKYAPEEAKKGESGDPTFTVSYQPKALNYTHPGENRYNCNGDITTYTMLNDLSDDPTAKSNQLAFIKKRVEQTYTVLYNGCVNNVKKEIVNGTIVNSSEATLEACLSKTIDMESFVDMYIFNEVVTDPDIGYSSFYLSFDNSADGDKKLRLDNPWDFDSAMGVRKDTVENSQGLYAKQCSNMWLSLLAKCDFFQEKVKAKWNTLRENQVFEKALDMMEDFSINYQNEYKKNYERWPKTMGNNPEVSFEIRDVCKKFKTEREAEQLLSKWLAARIDYLETQFGSGSRAPLSTGGSSTTGGTTGGNTSGGTTGGNTGFIPGGNTETPTVDYTEFKAAATKTRLEAEEANVDTDSGLLIKTKAGEGISGDKYVGELNGHAGSSVTFTHNSTKACEALLSVGLSARTSGSYKVTDLFDITVNGVAVTSNANVAQATGTDFHSWTVVDTAKVNLVSGNNTIVFTAKTTSTNFDFIDLYIPN